MDLVYCFDGLSWGILWRRVVSRGRTQVVGSDRYVGFALWRAHMGICMLFTGHVACHIKIT